MRSIVLAIILCGFQLLGGVLGPSLAQFQNGVVQLRDEQTIIIEGPLLGGQSRRFAQIVAFLYQSERQELTVYINSEGGSFDEANRIIGTMQVFQERGGTIDIIVPRAAICWSFCPMIFSFGDRRFADDETSWMFRRPVPDRRTQQRLSRQDIDRTIEKTNAFWMARLQEIDPQFASSVVGNWLQDDRDHKISGSELRQLSAGFLTRPDHRH